MADRVRDLLDHIVERYVVQDELRVIDLDAPPTEHGEAIESGKREAVRREAERADDLAHAFERGLALAHQGRAGGHAELTLDDREPDQDRMADALVRFLVSYDLATSRTEETEPMHYVYHVTVDWDRLAAVAADAEVDLDAALRKASA